MASLQLEEADFLARAATWKPVSPKTFLALAGDRRKRLADNEQELLALVVESLDRLQTKLKDELTAARDLWNIDRGTFWPKAEEEFSDYVSRHLNADIQDRGIIVNREVQIRRRQLTDIHIDAVIPEAQLGTYARVYVIVEAKGNWNPELFENMETQLQGRYLAENRCRSGIYLVVWFCCDIWNKQGDSRRDRCRSMRMEETRDKLARQAHDLTQDGSDIRSYVLDVSLS